MKTGSPFQLAFLLTAVGILVGSTAVVVRASQVAVTEIALPDQYGRLDSLASHQGNATVVMIVTARRLRLLKSWEIDLSDRYPNLHFMRVADVPEDPPADHAKVVEKLQKRVPPEVSVLIDMERRWARALGLETSEPNLLVFNSSGRMVSRHRGRNKSNIRAWVFETLDQLTAPAPVGS